MPIQEIEIINKLGLHARASAKLTQVASSFPCDVTVARNGRKVNAKSIMGEMMLAATRGSTITIETSGPEADKAMAAMVALINNRFDEAE